MSARCINKNLLNDILNMAMWFSIKLTMFQFQVLEGHSLSLHVFIITLMVQGGEALQKGLHEDEFACLCVLE